MSVCLEMSVRTVQPIVEEVDHGLLRANIDGIEPGKPPSPLGLEFTLVDLRVGLEGRVCLDRGSAVWEARIL